MNCHDSAGIETSLVEPESTADEPVYVVSVSPDEMVIEGSDGGRNLYPVFLNGR